jgi:protein phosphatase
MVEPKFTAFHFGGASRGAPGTPVSYRAGTQLGVVARGEGSFSGGSLAAELAVDLLPLALSTPSTSVAGVRWNDAARRVHVAIQRACEIDPFYRGMRATFAACHFDGTDAVVGHVGDCRVYRLRGDTFQRLTKDVMIDPSRAAGGDQELALDLVKFVPQHGDVVLLCTARAYQTIHESLLQELLDARRGEPEQAAREIADCTSGDEVAVVVGRVQSEQRRRKSDRVAVIMD